MKYCVGYDLCAPGRDYSPLIKRLGEWGAVRVLKSQWVISYANTTAAAIRDDLRKYIDANDKLLVVTMTGEAAWTSLEGNSAAFLRAKADA